MMATQILMPALSPTMTEGKLSRWLKSVGDEVHAGDVIAEIETDKAAMEVEAVDEGQLSQILIDEGTEGVAVNAPIAVLSANGEGVSAAPVVAKPPAAEIRSPCPGTEARSYTRSYATGKPDIWQFMRPNWLSNRLFLSYTNIVDHCCDAWNKLMAQPWTIMS